MIKNKLINNIAWNSIGSIVYLACQWFMTIVVVWIYDDFTNAGNLSLAMNITNIFYTLALFNIRIFQVSDKNNEFNDRTYIYSRVFTCVISFILCLIFVLFNNYFITQKKIIIFYMLYRSIDAFIDVLHGIDQKHWRMNYIGMSLIIRGILNLIIFIILGIFFDLLTSIFGMLVISLLICFLFDYQKAKILIVFSTVKIKNILILLIKCLPIMMSSLIIMFIYSYSRYSLEKIYGIENLGIYTSVIAPTIILQVVASLLFMPMINIFTNYLKDNNYIRLKNMFFLYFLFILFISIIFYFASIIFGEWGINILFGQSIIQYTYLLPEGIIVSGIYTVLILFNNILTIIRDIKGMLIGNIIGAVICLVITNYFLNNFYLTGANYVIIISQLFIIIYFLYRFIIFLFNNINKQKNLIAT